MKEELYKKMERLFPLLEHNYQEVGPHELTVCKLARGNTYNMRVVGLDGVKRLREKHPDSAITFKPNHLSEADFMLLSLLFMENNMRVVTEGGDNLFLEHIDVFGDILPLFVHPGFSPSAGEKKLSLADYLRSRGAFKVFREPQTLRLSDGEEVVIGKKDILTLSQAYRCHLVRQREMYVTFPGYSSVKSSFMGLIKKEGTKTGRSYTGKFDGFHHLPFQMDIEASQGAGVDVFIVPVNIAYSPVLEDELFLDLLRMQEGGAERNKVYLKDLEHVVRAFSGEKRKGELSIKFGEPKKIETSGLKDPFSSLKKKNAAKSLARSTFQKSLAMQPVFPANIYFNAFDEQFNRISVSRMRERIDDLRDRLRHLSWGTKKWRVDLHYVLDYRNHIMSADEIINRTFDLFNTPDRMITARDGDRFVVYNPHAALQYRNHIAHFLETDETEILEKKG
jgi:glycerol-3-phosphate O-acyltransferase